MTGFQEEINFDPILCVTSVSTKLPKAHRKLGATEVGIIGRANNFDVALLQTMTQTRTVVSSLSHDHAEMGIMMDGAKPRLDQ